MKTLTTIILKKHIASLITWFCYSMFALAVITFILMVLNNHEVSTTYKPLKGTDSTAFRPLSYQERMALNELVVRSIKLHK